MYLKDNGKVDVKRMLDEYGGKVKTNELRELSKIVTGMFKEELVDEEDYFYALKWIATKAKQKSTIINIKKKEFEVITSLDRE